jgi:cytochrome c-type biogenesis protein CcmH
MSRIAALLLWLLAAPALAIAPVVFDDPVQEQRYKALSAELRCLVCQNQNLADSNAELAQDLKQQLVEMIKAGRSDQEITDFMVARYGDFVLYRPPVKGVTALLWFGPGLILLLGLGLGLWLAARRRAAASCAADPAAGSGEAAARAHALLQADAPPAAVPPERAP